MLSFLSEHASNIVVGFILVLGLTLIIRAMIKDKRKGKSNCGCNCGNCASSGMCHPK